ncbi:hypothetical protein DIPPA_32436 [Diplonema papillatum]|nr:hypothetical protein DIPPA_32436 [Diplonema papillatum]
MPTVSESIVFPVPVNAPILNASVLAAELNERATRVELIVFSVALARASRWFSRSSPFSEFAGVLADNVIVPV